MTSVEGSLFLYYHMNMNAIINQFIRVDVVVACSSYYVDVHLSNDGTEAVMY